jgi:hypothetical protein
VLHCVIWKWISYNTAGFQHQTQHSQKLLRTAWLLSVCLSIRVAFLCFGSVQWQLARCFYQFGCLVMGCAGVQCHAYQALKFSHKKVFWLIFQCLLICLYISLQAARSHAITAENYAAYEALREINLIFLENKSYISVVWGP